MVKNFNIVERELQIGGRITLPITWRKEMDLKLGSKVTMKKFKDKIIIEPPVKLTSLRGIGKTKKPSQNPKKEAREWMKMKLEEELGK